MEKEVFDSGEHLWGTSAQPFQTTSVCCNSLIFLGGGKKKVCPRIDYTSRVA